MPDFIFRLPPMGDLTIPQQVALDEERPLLVTGGPGSGKTVVSIFRYLNQIAQTRDAIFFTFNRTLMSSIRGTLRQRAAILLPDLNVVEVENIITNNIGSIHEWYGEKFHAALTTHNEQQISANFSEYIDEQNGERYSELFIDEAQDLRPAIINSTYILAEKVSCGADRSQDIQGHYQQPADDVIYALLNNHRPTLRQGLTQNFRNTQEIFSFARNFVPNDHTVQAIDLEDLPNGEDPDIRGGLSDEEQLELIVEIIRQNPGSNIGIIVHFKKQIERIRNYFVQQGYSPSPNAAEEISFSYYFKGMPPIDKQTMENRLRTPFILTYESCKGLEFDIVILPLFNSADWALVHIRNDDNGNPEVDANGNPKYWSTPNHYYVAATRARSQLFLLYNQRPQILNFLA
jgi:superfamily I DNA/RNA helicase